MPYKWTAPDGRRMVGDCKYCHGKHLWDINACPAPAAVKVITECLHCGEEHPWDIDECPERYNIDMIYNCLFCGGDHPRDKEQSQCPAKNYVCETCNETGHFTGECKRLYVREQAAAAE
eukprot:TRINITY_DN13973_c0_g1_i4.p1 TRINITY_DN13973_c0_g1~~TRINITY_DN13973_c0_g1_i4.p1  ORF type:complete len:119 (-),score=24.03 TRINITY_DN13973_c0_g1_i4:353-709(-)